MVDANFALNLVETVGILVGITIAILEIRRSREERRYQAASEILELPFSKIPEHWTNFIRNSDFSTYEEWSEKYSSYSNPEAFTNFISLFNTFNMFGWNVIDGLIDVDMVLNRVGVNSIIGLWEKYSVVFHEWRKRYNYPDFGKGLEFLYNEAKKKYPEVGWIPNPDRIRLMQ
jgi:hypothetical protein